MITFRSDFDRKVLASNPGASAQEMNIESLGIDSRQRPHLSVKKILNTIGNRISLKRLTPPVKNDKDHRTGSNGEERDIDDELYHLKQRGLQRFDRHNLDNLSSHLCQLTIRLPAISTMQGIQHLTHRRLQAKSRFRGLQLKLPYGKRQCKRNWRTCPFVTSAI